MWYVKSEMAKRRETRAETAARTRKSLISAAAAEFSDRGLDASLDAICARAGVTRGAFYVHFADRDALISAVMDDVIGDLMRSLVERAPASRAGGALAQAIRLFFTAAAARSPAIHRGGALRFHHLMDACHRSPAIGATYRNLVVAARDQISAAIRSDQTADTTRADLKPDALADLMTIVALGTAAALELEIPVDLDRLRATTTAIAKA